MRKLLFLFIAVFMFSCSSDDGGSPANPEVTNPEPENPGSGGCKYLHDSVTLKTQKDVDSFAAFNYCEVEGNLFIGDLLGHSDITDLSKLSKLKRVSGQFVIEYNKNLVSLKGLENLEKVGTLIISNNDNLETLEHLTSLTEASPYGNKGSYINISMHLKLKSLKGLEKLENVNKITLFANYELSSLKGLEGLKKINDFTIQSCDAITTLDGLNNLTEIKNFALYQNNKITTLQHLVSLKTLSNFECYENEVLTSLSGFEQIKKIEHLRIGRSPGLSSFQGLHNVTEISYLELSENQSLTSLSGLENVKTLSGVFIYNSPNLVSLSQLSGVTALTEYANADEYFYQGIRLQGVGITSLSGLQNITSFKGGFKIQSNPNLTDFCAINNIVTTTTSFVAENNAYNPSAADIIAGNCSQ